MDYEKHFHLSVFGQLESLIQPLGCDSKSVYARYEIITGADWELVSGSRTGVTQNSSTSRKRFHTVALNMPLEFTYKSTNPFGWPQIVVSLWGMNFWGNEVCRGYCRFHIPLPQRNVRSSVLAPIITPKPMDFCSQFIGWFTDWSPELRDSSVLAHGNRSKGIHTQSYGHLEASFDVLTRGSEALQLEWNV
ncbi:B9 domain-containing protein 1 [Sergentomyia squamirostris]